MMSVETFGQRFRKARKAAGLSQDDIAEACRNRGGEELSRAAVSLWEKDVVKPSFDNLVAACKVMKASADYLLGLYDGAATPKPKSLEMNRDRILEAIEYIEDKLPPLIYPVPPKERAKAIYDVYRSSLIQGELQRVFSKHVKSLKEKYRESSAHGRKAKERTPA